MVSQNKSFILVIFLFFLYAGVAQATVIRSAVAVRNTFSEWTPGSYEIKNVSDQSGLNQNYISGVTDWDSYFSTSPYHSSTANGNEWWGNANSGLTGDVVFDLGEIYYIDKFAIWNEEENGISYLTISTSTDALSFLSVAIDLKPTNNQFGNQYTADIFSLTESMARYVKLEIFATGDNGYNTVSMGEIAFSTTDVAPAPEPSTALLLGIGLIGSSLAGRRMRSTQM